MVVGIVVDCWDVEFEGSGERDDVLFFCGTREGKVSEFDDVVCSHMHGARVRDSTLPLVVAALVRWSVDVHDAVGEVVA